jgi:hypothetical protein
LHQSSSPPVPAYSSSVIEKNGQQVELRRFVPGR